MVNQLKYMKLDFNKVRNWFRKVWNQIDKFIKKVDEAAEEYVPIIIEVCQGLKKAIENGTYDTVDNILDAIVPAATPYTKLIKDFLYKNLPSIIANLQLVNILANVDKDDLDAQFDAVFKFMQNGNPNALNSISLQLASDLIKNLSDGKFTGQERRVMIERYYTKIVINNEI